MNDTSSNFRIRNHNILYHYVDTDDKKVVKVPEGIEYICNNAFAKCNIEEVILPSTVKEIEESAFYYCKELTSIYIPKSVRIIHNTSFDSCLALSNINIEEGNNNYAFIDGMLCDKNSCELIYCCKTLRGNVTTPSFITKICNRAFSGCKEITELTLSDNIITLQKESLLGLNNLIKLTLPKKLKNLEQGIFKDLRKLVFINIDENNEEFLILDDIIYDEKKSHIFYIPTFPLEKVHISPTLKRITRRNFDSCEINELIFPENLDLAKLIDYKCEVGLFSYHNCQIHKLVIKNRKTKIHPDWFVSDWGYETKDKTAALHDMNRFIYTIYPTQIPSIYKKYFLNEVTKLFPLPFCEEEWRSAWCDYLKKNRKKLYSQMLENEKLLDIYLSKGLLDLEDVKQVTQLSEDLKNPELNARLLEYQNKNFSFEEIMNNKEKELLNIVDSSVPNKKDWNYKLKDNNYIKITNYKGTSSIVYIPAEIDGYIVDEIGENALSPNNGRINDIQRRVRLNITEVYLPNTITTIGKESFYGCKSLKKLGLPANKRCNIAEQKTIHENKGSFIKDCPSLTKIEIPEGITKLGAYAFSDNPYLEEITLPKSLEEIGPYCFAFCTSLKKIVLPYKTKILQDGTFTGCSELCELKLNNYLNKIGSSVMVGCKKLKQLYVPKSVQYIAPYAFRARYDLSNIELVVEKDSYAQKYAERFKMSWILKGYEKP